MIMLPVAEKWYRQLLVYAAAIGITGGIGALLYTFVTNAPMQWLFGDIVDGYWTGQWWWILLTAAGGGIVAYLRRAWRIPRELPSAIELGQAAIVDTALAPKLIVISVLSLVFGAALGPSYGIVLIGGTLGAWLFRKLKLAHQDKEIEREYTRTGMAGSLGSVFSDPLLGTLFTLELSPSKRNQLASSLPRLIAASLGFIIFFGVTGAALQDSYLLPGYEFQFAHLFVGMLLGVFALVTLLVFSVLKRLSTRLMGTLHNDIARGVIGGAIVGSIAYAVPLTLGSGNPQLSFATSDYTIFGAVFLLVVLLAKMVAVSVSQSSGFLGGNVFPMLFIGGVAGLTVHVFMPGVPVALCVSAMMAAVPGATLSTPVSIILISVLGIGLGTSAVTPVIMAVIVAQVGLAALTYLQKQRAGAASA